MRQLLRRPLYLLIFSVFLALAAFWVRWSYFAYPLNNELLHAARDGDLPRMETFLRKGADPNARSEMFWTPLATAADRGRLPAAAWLLDHGADPNRLEGGGNSPLFYAVLNGHAEIVDLLLRRGADPNARGRSARNLSPLAIAEQRGHPDLAARLRAAGAK